MYDLHLVIHVYMNVMYYLYSVLLLYILDEPKLVAWR